jgi:hypothetical protein
MGFRRVVPFAVLVVAIGCTDGRALSPTTTTARPEESASAVVTTRPSVADTTGSTASTTSPDSPPQVVVDSGTSTIVLTAWTWDTRTAAFNGTAPASPPDLGPVVDAVTLHVDNASWIVDATIEGSGCTIDKTASPSFAVTQVLRWSGPAGNYVVTLRGANADGRSLNVTFGAQLVTSAVCA